MLAIAFIIATTLLLFWLCAPERPTSVWEDTFKVLPYRGVDGKIHIPFYTQRRLVGGKIQYRERDETDEEWQARQY